MASSIGTNTPWADLLRPVWQLIALDRRELIVLLVYTVALGAITATVPFVSQILVNQAAFTGTTPPIVLLSLVVFGVMLIGVFIRLFQIRVSSLIAKRIFVRTSVLGTKSLLNYPSGKFEFDDREVANRFFDIFTFQVRFSVLISEGLSVLVFTMLGIPLLALYHPFFLALSLVITGACLVVIFFGAKRGIKNSSLMSEEKYNTAYWLSQVAEYRSLLRQSPNWKLTYARTDKLATQYVGAYFKYLSIILYQSGFLLVILSIATAAFFALGGWLVVKGELNLGQLVAAEIVILSIITALGRINFYLDSFYEMIVAAKKVADLTSAGGSQDDVHNGRIPDDFKGIQLRSKFLKEPVTLKPGDVVAIRSEKRSDCSVLLREMASSRADVADVRWLCDQHINRVDGTDLMLFLVRPAVLRMTLAENLALLSGETSIETARSSVLDVPMLTGVERANADTPLTDLDISMSDRARYAMARVFMTKQPVVMLDMFFNLMELKDQVTFVKEFRERFPSRILIINAFETAVDPQLTRVVTLQELPV